MDKMDSYMQKLNESQKEAFGKARKNSFSLRQEPPEEQDSHI